MNIRSWAKIAFVEKKSQSRPRHWINEMKWNEMKWNEMKWTTLTEKKKYIFFNDNTRRSHRFLVPFDSLQGTWLRDRSPNRSCCHTVQLLDQCSTIVARRSATMRHDCNSRDCFVLRVIIIIFCYRRFKNVKKKKPPQFNLLCYIIHQKTASSTSIITSRDGPFKKTNTWTRFKRKKQDNKHTWISLGPQYPTLAV